MRAQLETLAPALPGILEGLQGLGATGLTGLLLVAPDAPLTPSAFALLAQVGVSPIPGGDERSSTRSRTGRQLPRRPGPGRLRDRRDAFVVASSEALAREAATLPTEPTEPAATRIRLDVAAALERSGSLGDAELLARPRAGRGERVGAGR